MMKPIEKKKNLVSRSLKLAWLAASLSALAVLSHRFAIADFQIALLGLSISVLIGLAAIATGLVGTWRAISAKQPDIASTTAGTTLGLLVIAPVLATLFAGMGSPGIHDITTDLEHPPEFIAIKSLRTESHNPLDRLEPENLAALQQQGYPDLKPLFLNVPYAQVFDRAAALVKERGWEIASVSVASGRIEATDTTLIMGFKDDVVIRIQALEKSRTRIDMRSVSRVGRSDFGANAGRIRKFLQDLDPHPHQ
ncbi:MAG: DUF1499 domain-containing protein [Nitrosomonas sp.]|nr:MAG: DUF1499 domain-containing protein [Nitrosomonas sp.]